MFTHAPAELVNKLEELVPGFAEEKHKYAIATMLWMSTDMSRQHRIYPSSITLHTDEVKKLFGLVSNFKKINRLDYGRYFQVHRFSNYTGDPNSDYTNGYEPRPWMRAILEGYLEEHIGQEFRDARGLRRTPPSAIRTSDVRGNRLIRWQGVNIPNLISVNIDNLKLMAHRVDLMHQAFRAKNLPKRFKLVYGDSDNQFRSLKHQIHTLLRQAFHFGGLPIQYIQSNTGRLYAHGINLQTCKRQIKQAALVGLYEYDIEACHLTILSQMAAKFGFQCPVIEVYVAQKAKIRTDLALALNVEKDAIKRVLNATAYGARKSVYPEDAIPKIIGSKKAEQLYKIDFYRDLKIDISKAVDVILLKHPLSKKRFVNVVGKELIAMKGKTKLEFEDINSATKMAHLVQGVEAQVLEIAVRTFPSQIVLLQHDGFATRKPIDFGKLQKAVEDQTGYLLKFEEEQITLPDPDFDAHFGFFNTKLDYAKKVNINNGLDDFWESLLITVGIGRGDLLPAFPLPLPEGEVDF